MPSKILENIFYCVISLSNFGLHGNYIYDENFNIQNKRYAYMAFFIVVLSESEEKVRSFQNFGILRYTVSVPFNEPCVFLVHYQL